MPLLFFSLLPAPLFVFNSLMRRRFFVNHFDGRHAALRGAAAHHAGRVLRVAPGQLYELSDGHDLWLAQVDSSSRDSVEFSLVEKLSAGAPALHTSLLLAIVKFDRFEWALEKATELGISEITPLAAGRSEKGLITAAAKRAERWQKILLESAQQSRRLSAPVLNPATSPAEALRASASAPSAVRLFFSEERDAPSLRSALGAASNATGATIAIGPEGGWTPEERDAALAARFSEVSLGPLILRTETAVAAAIAAIKYALGD
jgi:16S rRNA (uracil1498-N3)-methyltransferase